ncbi:hypothetical protein H4219_005758 [Mycoemilia scoparia]|uniref:Uncharacterized protein n=1 Tax=Mycoemilia scoparia TaxID=417184 RepID=A0A9W8DJ78_9FUNG|nr:hypothetical protein H4219_005758 [Mycoemilia scoparia]
MSTNDKEIHKVIQFLNDLKIIHEQPLDNQQSQDDKVVESTSASVTPDLPSLRYQPTPGVPLPLHRPFPNPTVISNGQKHQWRLPYTKRGKLLTRKPLLTEEFIEKKRQRQRVRQAKTGKTFSRHPFLC